MGLIFVVPFVLLLKGDLMVVAPPGTGRMAVARVVGLSPEGL